MSPQRTETMFFHCRRGAPPRIVVAIGGAEVVVGTIIKYLEMTLDSKWGFFPHFEQATSRLGAVVASVGKLFSNIGGPYRKVKRLYDNVAHSVVIYGAPIWEIARWLIDIFVSYHVEPNSRSPSAWPGRTERPPMGDTILTSPLELVAEMHSRVFWLVNELNSGGGGGHPRPERGEDSTAGAAIAVDQVATPIARQPAVSPGLSSPCYRNG